MDNPLFTCPHWSYVAFAVLASAYQASRGWYFQARFARQQGIEATAAIEEKKPVLPPPSTGEDWFFRSLADAWLFAVCSVMGFASLVLAFRVIDISMPTASMSGGAATLVVFLIVFGVLGVAGQLPHLLQQGKFPR